VNKPLFWVIAVNAPLLSACGTATLDLSGYPDKAEQRLYADGRIGGDKGLASIDLRKTWRNISDSGDKKYPMRAD